MIDIILKVVCAALLAVIFIHTPRVVRPYFAKATKIECVNDRDFLARTIAEESIRWPSLKKK